MTFDSILAQYSGKKVFFRSFAGNGGDALLLMAADLLFKRNRISYQMAHENLNLDNEIVFIRGGGNLVKYYNHTADFIKKRCRNVKELIILPQTISGHEDVLSQFDCRMTVFCREQKSFDYVKSFSNIQNVYLADDMAFGIDLKKCFPTLPKVHRLIYVTKVKHLLSKVLKGKVALSVFLQKRDGVKLYAFRTDVERTGSRFPRRNVDVSEVINFDPNMGDVAQSYNTSYCIFRLINQNNTVHTNRLHIAIAAILLGKQVYFYGNAYYKNRSVYEYSIKGKFNNVTWIN